MPNFLMDELEYSERGKWMASLVTPRPLAWITTLSPDGNVANIAPFNSYCGLANSPPLVGVAFSERDGAPKDTFANIEATREFVLNIVTRPLAESMNDSAREAGRETDDFARLSLTRTDVPGVVVPRICECPGALACRVTQILELPPSRVKFVVAQVVGGYAADGYDPVASDVLASVAPLQYASLRDPFELPKVWG